MTEIHWTAFEQSADAWNKYWNHFGVWKETSRNPSGPLKSMVVEGDGWEPGHLSVTEWTLSYWRKKNQGSGMTWPNQISAWLKWCGGTIKSGFMLKCEFHLYEYLFTFRKDCPAVAVSHLHYSQKCLYNFSLSTVMGPTHRPTANLTVQKGMIKDNIKSSWTKGSLGQSPKRLRPLCYMISAHIASYNLHNVRCYNICIFLGMSLLFNWHISKQWQDFWPKLPPGRLWSHDQCCPTAHEQMT